MNFKLYSILILFLISGASSIQATTSPVFKSTGELRILEGGRQKPLDSFAWETLRSLRGKTSFEGMDPTELVLSIAADPEKWAQVELVRMDYIGLKKQLGMPPGRKYFSYNELVSAPRFKALAELAHRAGRGDTLRTKLSDEMERVYGKLITLSGLFDGSAFQIVPAPQDPDGNWRTPANCTHLDVEAQQVIQNAWQGLLEGVRNHDSARIATTTSVLNGAIEQIEGADLHSHRLIRTEIKYNHLRPFRVSMYIYFLLVVTGLIALFFRNRIFFWINTGLTALGLFFHSLGLYYITVITGRAPISNLYESLIAIIWGFILLSLLFNLKYKAFYMGLITGIIGYISMVLAHNTSIDISINPLVPVLRSSWLNYHVSTILISYSAFALAMGLGHVWLVVYLLRSEAEELLKTVNDFTYRVLQLGNLTLAVGILLGALWANESWGRYWGWDPKETWSLITWFIYLGVLHARSNGWIHRKGLAVLSVISFASVIMTYYGVNYFLTGLHSYASGRSEGIPPLLFGYLAFEIAFLLLTTQLGKRRRAAVE